ncbi:MAG: PAS domain-containing sensor histidine kinase, partial [Hymenobacter sp.]
GLPSDWTLPAVFAVLPGAALLLTPEFQIAAVSDTYLAVSRTTREQLLGRNLFEAFPGAPGTPEEVAMTNLLASLRQVLATGKAHEMAGQHYALPGPAWPGAELARYWQPRNAPVLNAQGAVVGLLHQVENITEQVLARQQQLHDLFEQAPVALAIVRGPQYVIELLNPAVCAMWGRTLAQALHTPLFELLPEAAGQGFEQLLEKVMATGVPHVAHELPVFIDRQGQRDTVYWKINRQLTRTNQDLDNFIYTASHDLWAPISNIEGLLTALRTDLALPAAQAQVPQLLELMQGAVDRFKRTIRNLTDVARLQQSQAQPATLVDLAQLVQEVSLDLSPQFAAAAGELTLDVTDCPVLYFSEKNLRSIVYNLLSNGLKYCHPARAPRLLVHCYATADATVLAVHDNGLGLTPAQQGKVFGLFQRQHDHVEGSGVGLYMVKKIVEQAGGAIELESQLGEGSTFLVYFAK